MLYWLSIIFALKYFEFVTVSTPVGWSPLQLPVAVVQSDQVIDSYECVIYTAMFAGSGVVVTDGCVVDGHSI